MKRIRALDKETGKFVKELDASEVTEETRYKYDYGCMDAGCSARFHWVKPHDRSADENTDHKRVQATFSRNSSTSHEKGCEWDYVRLERENPEFVFVRDGVPHVVINFPIGGAYTDLRPEHGGLTKEQVKAAKGQNYKPLSSMSKLVKFLELEFGSLESPALENLVLHYQGRDYKWPEVFIGSQNYKPLLSVPKDPHLNTPEGRIVVVKTTNEIGKSPKGKRRFACMTLTQDFEGTKKAVQPIIVCASDEIADQIQNQSHYISVARPFVPDSQPNGGFVKGNKQCVYLYVASDKQMAEVAADYWHLRSQKQLFEISGISSEQRSLDALER